MQMKPPDYSAMIALAQELPLREAIAFIQQEFGCDYGYALAIARAAKARQPSNDNKAQP